MKRQPKFIITEAFPEPIFTQVPNRFFDMLAESMESSEARVTMIMIRETYGYHRASFKMGIDELATKAGISRGAAKIGAEAAELRGTFKRVNPDDNKKAEWSLSVGQPLTSNDCIAESQPLTSNQSTIDPLPPVKERNKEEIKKPDIFDGMLYYQRQAENQKVDEIEQIAVALEVGLRFNFPRGTKDQAVYKRILKSGKPVERFIEWVKSDEKRLSYAFLYAKDTETIWRDWPQVDNISMNPQGLEIGL
jgi:hypothetical protein